MVNLILWLMETSWKSEDHKQVHPTKINNNIKYHALRDAYVC